MLPVPGRPIPSNTEGLHSGKEEVYGLLSKGWIAAIASDGGEPVSVCGFSADGEPLPFHSKVIPLCSKASAAFSESRRSMNELNV